MPLNLGSRKRRHVVRRPPSAATVVSLRAVLYTLLAASFLMIVHALRAHSAGWLVAGLGAMFVAGLLKLEFERRLRTWVEPQLRQRLQALLRTLRTSEEKILIHGSRGWLAPIGTTVLGVGLIFEGVARSVAGFAIVFCVLLLAALMWLRRLPHLKKPVLILSSQGLQAPPREFIPWERVLRMSLQEVEVRSVRLHHQLQVTVSALNNHLPGSTPLQRFVRRLRRAVQSHEVRIALRYTSEDPQMIGSLADLLWRGATVDSRPLIPVPFDVAIRMDHDLDVIRQAARSEPLDTEHDVDIIREAARAEPLDFDFSALDDGAKDSRGDSARSD